MSKTVVVYPSGFVGYDIGLPIVRNESNIDASNALVRFASVSLKDKLVVANRDIETLYQQMRVKARSPRQADFIGDVAAACANAFGCDTFYEWCHMQLESPYFTADHREYLNDAILFLTTGNRNYTHATWASLLQRRRATLTDRNVALNHAVLVRYGKPDNTINVVSKWFQHPGGVEDLLRTLHLIFGEIIE